MTPGTAARPPVQHGALQHGVQQQTGRVERENGYAQKYR